MANQAARALGVPDELGDEIDRVWIEEGWQGFADRPDLIQVLITLTPDMPDEWRRVTQEIYRGLREHPELRIVIRDARTR